MKKIISALAALIFVTGINFTAQANSFYASTLVSGVDNTFEDQSRDVVVDINANGKLDSGDVFFGFVRLDNKTSPSPAISLSNKLYAVFSQQVDTITPTAAGYPRRYDIVFKPTTVAGLRLSDFVAGAPASGIGTVFDRAGGAAFGTDLINASPGDVNGDGQISMEDYIKSITNQGILEAVVGLGTAPSEADDFYDSETGALPAVGVDPFATLAILDGLPSSATLGGYAAGLSIDTVLNPLAPTVTYNEVVASNSNITGVPSLHELGISGGSIFGASNLANYSETSNAKDYPNSQDFGIADKANFIVNPNVISEVPEPNTILLLGSGLVGFAALSYGRLRKKS